MGLIIILISKAKEMMRPCECWAIAAELQPESKQKLFWAKWLMLVDLKSVPWGSFAFIMLQIWYACMSDLYVQSKRDDFIHARQTLQSEY